MADTARAADTRDALRRLAGRFTLLAESRIADHVGRRAMSGSRTMLHPTDTPATNP